MTDDWSPPEVSTPGLRSAAIPLGHESLEFAGESLSPIWRFSLTYDPRNLARVETIRLLADLLRARFERDGELPGDADLDLLRACLSAEHEYWRATGPGGDVPRGQTWEESEPQHAAFVRALVREIHTRVYQEESWWWEPDRTPELWKRNERALGRSREGRRLARLYELAAEHIGELIEMCEHGLPNEDQVILEALDPPIVHEPEPTDKTPPTDLPDVYRDERDRAVQRLAVALFIAAPGSGIERLRSACSEALESAGRLGH